MSGVELRPASLDDAALAADIYSAQYPDEPLDPLMLRYEWEHTTWTADRSVIERDGRAIGSAYAMHPDWEKARQRFAIVGADLLPQHRSVEALVLAFAEMERRATAQGARLAATRAREDDRVLRSALEQREFREDRRSKKWELDLVAGRERILAMTANTRARMAGQGIALTTLAADGDPERYRKTWRMSEEASADVPSTLGHVKEPFDDFMKWLRAPGMHEDRVWIAREGDDVVGMSVLEYPPVRGVVGTAWTATARQVRGRGIARALKCETLAQAIALGVDRVRTGNDAKNDPILHLNESMGYRRFAIRIHFHKDL